MRKHVFYLFIISLALFSACENEIPFHSGKQEPKLLLNALLGAGTNNNLITLRILKENKSYPVSNGNVTVHVNGEKKEEIKFDYLDAAFPTTLFQPGDRIRLEATAEDSLYQVYAEVEIPQPLDEIIQVDTFLTKLKVGLSMENCIRYKITFRDRPDENNYYQLFIQENEFWGNPDDGWDYVPSVSMPDIISQEDIVLTDGHLTTADDDEFGILDMVIRNKYNIFTDTRFRNDSYTMKVYTRYRDYMNWHEENHMIVEAEIHLRSISKDYYRYLRAMNCLESENYNATFMEPVIIPCNVHGGLGFVGVSSDVKKTIRITDRPPLRPKK